MEDGSEFTDVERTRAKLIASVEKGFASIDGKMSPLSKELLKRFNADGMCISKVVFAASQIFAPRPGSCRRQKSKTVRLSEKKRTWTVAFFNLFRATPSKGTRQENDLVPGLRLDRNATR